MEKVDRKITVETDLSGNDMQFSLKFNGTDWFDCRLCRLRNHGCSAVGDEKRALVNTGDVGRDAILVNSVGIGRERGESLRMVQILARAVILTMRNKQAICLNPDIEVEYT